MKKSEFCGSILLGAALGCFCGTFVWVGFGIYAHCTDNLDFEGRCKFGAFTTWTITWLSFFGATALLRE